jgi:hypothetical protein
MSGGGDGEYVIMYNTFLCLVWQPARARLLITKNRSGGRPTRRHITATRVSEHGRRSTARAADHTVSQSDSVTLTVMGGAHSQPGRHNASSRTLCCGRLRRLDGRHSGRRRRSGVKTHSQSTARHGRLRRGRPEKDGHFFAVCARDGVC